MKDPIRWLLLLVVVGVIAAAFYWQYMAPSEPPPAPGGEAQPAPDTKAEPAIRHPIQEIQPEEAGKEATPLPPLNESDPAMQEALVDLFGQASVKENFYLKNIVHRLVVTIDNLPRTKLPRRFMPVKPAAGKFQTVGKEEDLTIGPENHRRYLPYVLLADAVDAKALVAMYVRFYPLFQQQYEELGYPKGYFNDRLIEVIDHLLAAPDVQGPIRLVQPKVMYEFADPDLEALSAGQKIMIRIGGENAARIKAKLRELRRELTAQAPKQ